MDHVEHVLVIDMSAPDRIVWLICGEVEIFAASPRVSEHIAAVCKTVGFAYPSPNLDLPGQEELAFHRHRRAGAVA